MHEREFKKLLIDLDLSIAEIGRRVGLSRTGVRKYFGDKLRDPQRRSQIKRVLEGQARKQNVRLPGFWVER